MAEFGRKIRELRLKKGFTQRSLAKEAGVDFTYLSKIETGKAGYEPGADTIRALAKALGEDPLEFLRLADKVPPELQELTEDAKARRFFRRAKEVASSEDWDALFDLLEHRQKERESGRKK